MSDSQSEDLNIVIKSSGNEKFEISASPSTTVEVLKTQLESLSSIPARQQRLIYSGRVLKDAETLSSYNIKSGHTVHLVKGAVPKGPAANSSGSSSGVASSTPAAPAANNNNVPTNLAAGQGTGNPLSDLTGARYAGLANLPSASIFGPDGGMGPTPNMENILEMMEMPGYQEAVQQMLADPETLAMMMPQAGNMSPEQSAHMRQMLSSPEMRQLLTNPQAIRQIMQMSAHFNGMAGNQGGAGAGANSFPTPGVPGSNNNSTSNNNASTNADTPNPFAALLGAQGGNPFGGLGGLGGLGGFSGLNAFNSGLNSQPAQQQETDTRPPEERYESQLRQLNELGFYDFERNVRALRRAGGNVQGAIEALLDGQV